MSLIVSFIAGSLFTLLLTGACVLVSYKVLEYKSEIDIKQSEQRKRIIKQTIPTPQGGVIKPKTPEQKAQEADEILQAFKSL